MIDYWKLILHLRSLGPFYFVFTRSIIGVRTCSYKILGKEGRERKNNFCYDMTYDTKGKTLTLSYTDTRLPSSNLNQIVKLIKYIQFQIGLIYLSSKKNVLLSSAVDWLHVHFHQFPLPRFQILGLMNLWRV